MLAAWFMSFQLRNMRQQDCGRDLSRFIHLASHELVLHQMNLSCTARTGLTSHELVLRRMNSSCATWTRFTSHELVLHTSHELVLHPMNSSCISWTRLTPHELLLQHMNSYYTTWTRLASHEPNGLFYVICLVLIVWHLYAKVIFALFAWFS